MLSHSTPQLEASRKSLRRGAARWEACDHPIQVNHRREEGIRCVVNSTGDDMSSSGFGHQEVNLPE